MITLLFSVEDIINNRLLGPPRRWLEHNRGSWLSVIIIAGLLLVSAGLPFVASWREMALVIGLVPVVGVMLAFTHWPPLGLLALIVTALVVPSPDLPGGFNFAILLLILLIGLWWLDMILSQRHIRLLSSRTVAPLLALIAASVLAFGVGQLPWFTLACFRHRTTGLNFAL